jgi:hypothetical protein
MKKKTIFTKDQWIQAFGVIEQMSPIELKKLHIFQVKDAIKQHPEMKDQLVPLLDKYRNELLTMKLEATE